MSHSARRNRDVKAYSENASSQPFAMLPLEVAADPDLSPGAKILFAMILTLTKGAWGRCCARNEKLAEMTGLSVIQTRRLLQDLEKHRFISRTMEGTRRCEIQVTWTPDRVHQNDTGPCIKMIQGQDQIDAPNEITNEMTNVSRCRVEAIQQNFNPPALPDPNGLPPCPAEEIHAALFGAKEQARVAEGAK